MTKHVIATIILWGSIGSGWAQLQLTQLTINDSTIHTIPRYTWQAPLYKTFRIFNTHGLDLSVAVGGHIRNHGLIYDLGPDRYKHRIISIGPAFKIPIIIAKKISLTVGYGLNYPIHYKEKVLKDRMRKNKSVTVSEWLSKRTVRWHPHVMVKIGMIRGITVEAEVFPQNFFNTNYAEPDEMGGNQYPYQGWSARIVNVDIGFQWLDPNKKPTYYEDE